jgi:hypothetical protein
MRLVAAPCLGTGSGAAWAEAAVLGASALANLAQ